MMPGAWLPGFFSSNFKSQQNIILYYPLFLYVLVVLWLLEIFFRREGMLRISQQ